MNNEEVILKILTDIQDNIVNLQTDVQGLQTDVQGLRTDVQGLKNDMQDVKGEIKKLQRSDELILDEVERVHEIFDRKYNQLLAK